MKYIIIGVAILTVVHARMRDVRKCTESNEKYNECTESLDKGKTWEDDPCCSILEECGKDEFIVTEIGTLLRNHTGGKHGGRFKYGNGTEGHKGWRNKHGGPNGRFHKGNCTEEEEAQKTEFRNKWIAMREECDKLVMESDRKICTHEACYKRLAKKLLKKRNHHHHQGEPEQGTEQPNESEGVTEDPSE